jgi:hypothetical protein
VLKEKAIAKHDQLQKLVHGCSLLGHTHDLLLTPFPVTQFFTLVADFFKYRHVIPTSHVFGLLKYLVS